MLKLQLPTSAVNPVRAGILLCRGIELGEDILGRGQASRYLDSSEAMLQATARTPSDGSTLPPPAPADGEPLLLIG